MNGGDIAQVVTAVAALVVSLVALLATFMQVMQQYYASAAGYSQCSEKVMGEWAKWKRRRFSWEELRFEVQFHAPVIFACKPDNKFGPIANQEIHLLSGTPQSLKNTWTASDIEPIQIRPPKAQSTGRSTGISMGGSDIELAERGSRVTGGELKKSRDKIRTANNERASWFMFLNAVQQMESGSREWQEKQYQLQPCKYDQYTPPQAIPSVTKGHTFVVALQRQERSWDTMPSSIRRPYATTTMCHLIEMLAALGLYWKEFDRRKDRYWAEGNGFLVLGERVTDLGLMFSFQVYGQWKFEENRVIPVDDIKELSFGYVPTIYRGSHDGRRLQAPDSLETLQMSSRREMAESLTAIGCSNTTAHYFLDEASRTSHLFPVSFEIVGMISRNYHIHDSSFTFIPNPTIDRWDKRSLSLLRLLQSFHLSLHKEQDKGRLQSVIVEHLQNKVSDVLEYYPDSKYGGHKRLHFLRILHSAVDNAEEILTGRSVDPYEKTNADMSDANKRREMVQLVLRAHLQEVLKLLNERDVTTSDTQAPQVTESAPDGVTTYPLIRFDAMDDASPDEREYKFMEVYFQVVRPLVLNGVAQSTIRRADIARSCASIRTRRSGAANRPHSSAKSFPERKANNFLTEPLRARPGSSQSALPTYGEKRNSLALGSELASQSGEDNSNAEENSAEDDRNGNTNFNGEDNTLRMPLKDVPPSHEDLWVTLVFRMICWLMLHDFNRLDVQIGKSELWGSRMPVYIS